MNILVSSCLMGVNCRYNGKGRMVDEMYILKEKYNLIPVCPELYGGLSIPREAAEQKDGLVITKSGKNFTDPFRKGAEEVLKLAKFYDCKYAILKERSPSCGFGKVYDGTFSDRLIDGNGVLAELLSLNGIKIIGESNIKELI